MIIEKKAIEIGKVIKSARIMKGYSLDDVVRESGKIVSKQALSKYERSLMKPSAKVLKKLSSVLSIPIDFINNPEFKRLETDILNKNRISAKLFKTLCENISYYVKRYKELENILGQKREFCYPFEIKPIIQTEKDAAKLANDLRKLWVPGISLGINNVVDLLENNGIIVMEYNLPNYISALAAVTADIPVIVIKKDLDNFTKRLEVLKQLCLILCLFPTHMPLFDASGFSKDFNIDDLAEIFALEFLIPSKVFKEITGPKRKRISMLEFSYIRKNYGISIRNSIKRSWYLGIISHSVYKGYNTINSNSLDIDGKDHHTNERPLRFLKMLSFALYEELITIDKAAYLTTCPIGKLYRLLEMSV